MDSIHLSEPEGIVCLLGKNIGYTLSPVMHNSALERYNIPWVYLPLDLDEDFIPLVRDCSSLPIKGFNVTTPYKEKVIMFLDSVSKECEEIRAVNTITIHNGKLCGYNTDAPAFRDVLMQRVHARGIENLSGLKALVIGAGGVARSAVYTLKKEGAEIYLINRSESRAERLAGEFGCKMWGGLSSGKKFIPEVDLIVNCTPVSSSDELPIPRGSITPHHIVMDMVYQPFRTVLLERAAEQGATVIEGIHTLAHQAALSFKLWTDRDITPDFMLESAMKYIMHNNSRQ
jgi:shikimate dehydrogenase